MTVIHFIFIYIIGFLLTLLWHTHTHSFLHCFKYSKSMTPNESKTYNKDV